MPAKPDQFADLSSCQLRLELAEAQAERCRTLVAISRKELRIQAIVAELLKRGSF